MLKMMKKPLALLLALVITISVMPSIVSADSANLPERADVSLDGFSWSLETLDGRTINQDTYADKTVLFVFYRATLSNNNVGICYNSRAVISDLANCTWTDREDIQVIAVDGDIGNNAADVARYKEIYAPDCDNIDFAVNGNKLLWSLIRKVNPSAGTATFAVCTVIKNNTIYYEWDGCTSASYCKNILESILGDFDDDTDSTITKVNLNVEKHTRAEIRAFVDKNYASMSQPVTYSVEPSLSEPYAPGVLSDETAESALNLLNQVRYIAGLNADVTLDPEKSKYAAAGTLLNHLNNTLSHYPVRPNVLSDSAYNELYDMGYAGSSSSNIASGYRNLNQAIIHGWLADDDSSNIDRVGHRRWFLSPSMTTVGFGATGRYSAAYVFGSFWNGATDKYVAWPAQEMPVDYFSADYPWSVSLGYSLDSKSVSVSLVRKSDGQTWNFSDSHSDGDFYVNSARYGSPACIIFRPDSLDKISAGDSFDVSILISDPYDVISIEYTVNFFDLADTSDSENDDIIGNIGDVNRDGKVNSEDASYILKNDVGLIEFDDDIKKVADVNADSKVNSEDASDVLKKEVGLIDKFAAETGA